MKILLVLILLLPTAFAINLTVDYPKNVLLNSEFEIGIYSNSSESFDIKIDIFEDEKRISRIWNGEKWASTMYYLINDFSSEKTYQLKTENHIGIADLIVKLRKDKDVFIFGPYQINIDKSNSENNEIENKETEDNVKEYNKSEKEKIIPTNNIEKKETQPKEIIKLNPKTIKTKENNVFLGKGFAKYSIGIFCVILFFLYMFKEKEKQNEFG